MNNIGDINKSLIQKAMEAASNSYSPYSEIKIGAAVLTEENNIFTGCNIENSSYSLTICAERVAAAKAVSSGQSRIAAIAIYSKNIFPVPCGACAQFIAEFSPDLAVIIKNQKKQKLFKLSGILPTPFKF